MKYSIINERKISKLIREMTVEEKVLQLQQVAANGDSEIFESFIRRGAGSFLHVLGKDADAIREKAAQTRMKIPPIFGIDAIHGHALVNGAVVFPSQLAAACSWNRELIRQMGKATAEEVNADGLDFVFSPVLCLARDTRWGRVDETFGEDPYLAGELGAAIVHGYEDNGLVAACLKHYIGYGEATGARDAYDTEVTERKIREVFLPPFVKGIKAGASTVMTAYGSIDGVPMTVHRRLLSDVLKKELGFKGFVITDWDNVKSYIRKQRGAENFSEASKATLEAGNDMAMVSTDFCDAVIAGVRSGAISEKTVDHALRRILRVKFSLGLFDKNRKRLPRSVIGSKEHIEINHRLARESLVLLENDGILPLKSAPKTIAVIGPNADNIKAQYGDWTFFSHPDPHPDAVPTGDVYTVLRGIETVFPDSGIIYKECCGVHASAEDDIKVASVAAMMADIVIFVCGDDLSLNGETRDRANLELSGRQNEVFDALKKSKKPIITVLVNGKPLCIEKVAKGSNAVIEMFNGGDLGGLAVAELIAGKFCPSGKLPISFPRASGQVPCYYNHLSGWHGGKYVDVDDGALYPFGYGLSYTSFEYSDMKLSKGTATAKDAIDVSVTVTNTGSYDGMEIVQLYYRDEISSVMQPVIQLCGFEKVGIKAGKSKRVTIPLKISDLAIVHPDLKTYVEPGKFTIYIGKNTEENLSAPLTVI